MVDITCRIRARLKSLTTLLPLLIVSPVLAEQAAVDDQFVQEIPNPNLRIIIPDIPNITLNTHPNEPGKPHLKATGTKAYTSVFVYAPKSERAMTPLACANTTARAVMQQLNLPEEKTLRHRVDDNTFVLLYGLPLDGQVRLNAHILSAAEGNYCIDVYIFRLSAKTEEVEAWFNGFKQVRIETP